MQGYLSIYLSVTFAYLVVAHTVGEKLTGFQAIVISSIYVFAALISWGGMLVSQLWAENLLLGSPIEMRTQALKLTMNMEFWEIALGVLVFAGILTSVFYLYNIRRSSRN